MSVPGFDEVVATRHSCRAFTDAPVPDDVLAEVLGLAQQAPSWCNTQPWQVHLVTGSATAAFAEHLGAAVLSGSAGGADLGAPERYDGVYAERRRTSGYALYASLGIAREDRDARAAQMLANFSFFGAPHVLVVTTDRGQGTYGAIDCGGYVTTLMLAAASRGLGTCAQGAVALYSDAVRSFLDLPEDRLVVCAVAMGHPDAQHPANGFRTERARLEDAVTVVSSADAGAEATGD